MHYRAHPAPHHGSDPVCSGSCFCPPGSSELRGRTGLAASFTVLPSFSSFTSLGPCTTLKCSGYLSSMIKRPNILNTSILILETKLWSVAGEWCLNIRLLLQTLLYLPGADCAIHRLTNSLRLLHLQQGLPYQDSWVRVCERNKPDWNGSESPFNP